GTGEIMEPEPLEDLAFALIQMKTEMLKRVDEAIRRCDEGTYGYCAECDDPIAEPRLRAMPFAVRCKDCEELREYTERRDRSQLQRLASALGSRFDSAPDRLA